MRLIDADALIEDIKKQKADNDEHCRICIDAMTEIVAEQPTAFDADMVYRQMWKESEEVCGNTMIDLEVADEIIRNGGKE